MRIRRLVEQVDEQHREAMRTIEDDLGELHFGARSAESRTSRVDVSCDRSVSAAQWHSVP